MPASGSAARRYAEAMLSFATDERTVTEFRSSLERLAAAFDRATMHALDNPAMPRSFREQAVAAATKDEPVAIRSLLRLLVERERIALVSAIARSFADIVDARAGVAKARITTAVELNELEREGLVRRLEQKTGRKIRATFAVDPGLIGGTRLQVGDHLIDASLRARLAALGRQLAS